VRCLLPHAGCCLQTALLHLHPRWLLPPEPLRGGLSGQAPPCWCGTEAVCLPVDQAALLEGGHLPGLVLLLQPLRGVPPCGHHLVQVLLLRWTNPPTAGG
jgi:hypothetical protein